MGEPYQLGGWGGRDRGGKFNATGSSLYDLEYMLAKKKSISKNKGGLRRWESIAGNLVLITELKT